MKKGVTILAVLAIVGVAIFFYLHSKGGPTDNENYPYTYRKYKNTVDWQGGETKPMLPADLFTGKARQAYESAAAIPDVLDHLYCYCYCAEHHGHKSLRSCFTDDHGAECDICINEALLARQLHEKGTAIKDIRAAIDAEFYRPYKD